MAFCSTQRFPWLFLVGAFISLCQSFARPDWNLPLMTYAFLTWNMERVGCSKFTGSHFQEYQRIRIINFMVFAALMDML